MNIATVVGAIFLLMLGLYGISYPSLTTMISNRVRSILGLSAGLKPKVTGNEHRLIRFSSIVLIVGSIIAILLEINNL